MKSRKSLITSAVAVVLVVAATATMAYDRGRSQSQGNAAHYALSVGSDTTMTTISGFDKVAVAVQSASYQATASPSTVVRLGARKGCVLQRRDPAKTACDLAIAFPDVGLKGTVAFTPTTRGGAPSNLTLNLGG